MAKSRKPAAHTSGKTEISKRALKLARLALGSPVGAAAEVQGLRRDPALLEAFLAVFPEKTRLHPNPFPKAFKEFASPPKHRPPSLNAEVAWASEVCIAHSESLNRFLAAQKDLEQNMLLGEYSSAQNNLDQINEEFGASLWWVEATILLKNATSGTDVTHSTTILEAVSGNLYAYLVASSLLMRANREASVESFYKMMVESSRKFHTQKNWSTLPSTYDAWWFRAAPTLIETAQYDELANYLSHESSLPVIDVFQTLRTVIERLYSSNRLAKLHPRLSSIVGKLNAVFDVQWLANLRLLHGWSVPSSLTASEIALRKASEAYAEGAYQSCLTLSIEGLRSFPQELSFVELAVRANSKIANTLPVLNEDSEETYLGSMGKSLTDFLYRAENAKESLNQIINWGLMFCNMDVGRKLTAVPSVNEVMGAPLDLNSSTYKILRSELMQGGGSTLARHLCAVLQMPLVFSADIASVPPDQLIYAHELVGTDRVNEGYLVYQEILSGSTSALERADALVRLVALCCKHEFWSDCVKTITDVYISDPNLLVGCNLHPLAHLGQTRVYEDPPPGLKATPAWPLSLMVANRFTHLEPDSYSVYVAYDYFLQDKGALIPTEAIKKWTSEIQQDRVFQIFLLEVCVLEVMDHSPHFESLAELESERLAICSFLKEVCGQDADQLDDEIRSLVREQSVRAIIRDADKSKIHVNTYGVMGRFRSMLVDVVDIIRMHSLFGGQGMAIQGMEIQGPLSQYLITVVRNFLTAVFTELAWSTEHGLDSNLSIRIRHGTLEGHIRGYFESFQLVTSKAKPSSGQPDAERYADNEHWGPMFAYDDGHQRQVLDALNLFSHGIDSLIAHIKDDLVQIRSENRPFGVFDVVGVSESDVSPILETFDPNEFERAALSLFWDKVGDGCTAIRQMIESSVHNLFLQNFQRLEDAIASIDKVFPGYELKRAVESCRAGLLLELQLVATWFTRPETGKRADFALEVLIRACVASMRRASQLSEKITFSVCALPPVSGTMFDHCYALFGILIDNGIRHGNHETVDVSVSIDERGWLSVSVLNSVDEEQYRKVVECANELMAHANERTSSDSDKVRTEGGTGFYKLGRVLRHDLGRHDNYHVAVLPSESNQRYSVAVTVTFETKEFFQ